MRISDLYTPQQVVGDFFHCRLTHISNDNNMQKFICNQLIKKYKCKLNDNNCMTIVRHNIKKQSQLPTMQRSYSSDSNYNLNDMVYSQICDEIHNCMYNMYYMYYFELFVCK